MNTVALDEAFHENEKRFIEEWKHLLTFPSIGTDPEREADCRVCAEWLREHLDGIGLESQLLETPTQPVVFARHEGAPDSPTVLLYGHYDVQPVDPIEAWESPPFEPVLKDGRMYARGAQDNKGQFLYALKAVEIMRAAKALNPTVKIILEGEEESGSGGLSASLAAWREKLKADILMVHDTGGTRSGAPAITMGLRGLLHLSVVIDGPTTDLHSGSHGGCAPNPAAAMARLLAGLHREDGGIAVEGYYDGVQELSAREAELVNAISFDAAEYERTVGVPPLGGEHSLSPQKRTGFRPTIEINGVHSGYGGAGMKTIIPARAEAKITSRLVAGQDPARCLEAIVRHIEMHAPRGLRLEIKDPGIGGPGFRLNPDSEIVNKAGKVIERLTGHNPDFRWEGASIPVVCHLAETSGAEPLMVGFGSDEDHVHAPNESFSIEQFRSGFLYVAAMLSSL